MENFAVLSYFYGSTIIINLPINVDVSPEFSILDYVYFNVKCFLNVFSIFTGIWKNNDEFSVCYIMFCEIYSRSWYCGFVGTMDLSYLY